MNEITRIHLARMPYDIEIPAKKALEQYLADVRASMKADDDMMFEVESRIVELLAEDGIVSGAVITAGDISRVRQQLGEPRDFAEDADAEPHEQTDEPAERSVMRLYRDSQSAWLGGVAAGLAARTGLPVLLVRLVIVVLAIASFGVVFVAYILAWALIPDAKSAAQRLEMRGQPVTLSALTNLENSVSEVANHARRPLVMLLRVMITLGSLLVMAGAIAALVVMPSFLLANSTVISNHDGAGAIVTLATVVGLGLLLLAALAMIVAYAGAVWRVTKRMAMAASVIIAAGLTMALIALGSVTVLGVPVASSQMGRGLTSKNQPKQLAGVSKIRVEGAKQDVTVNYVVVRSADEYRVETFNSSVAKQISASVTKDGNMAVVHIDSTGDCWKMYGKCLDRGGVTVYGPELKEHEGVGYMKGYYPDEDLDEAAADDRDDD